jgi:hypothetical protein
VRILSQGTALMERARAVIPNGMYRHEATGWLLGGYPQFFAKARRAARASGTPMATSISTTCVPPRQIYSATSSRRLRRQPMRSARWAAP